MNPQGLTNEKLLFLCHQYGERAKFWRQKFIGLLPEVYKRKLYEKKFSSIFEFAAKLAGVSQEQVRRVLNLEKRLHDKSQLHKALINGEVSMNKLRRIAPIATQENQHVLLEQIKVLPQSAIEALVRDERNGRAPTLDQQSAMLQEPSPEPILSEQVKKALHELQLKGIDIDELILGAIRKRKQEISQTKKEFAREQETAEDSSRHIPRKIQKLIRQEHGTKCSMLICSAHHTIAHRIHATYEEIRRRAIAVPQ